MQKIIPALTILLMLLNPIAGQTLEILSPTEDGVVIGNEARFIINCSGTPEIRATIDEENYDISWTKELYGDRWTGDLELPHKGEHTVMLEGKCGEKDASGEVKFSNDITKSVEIADMVIHRFFDLKTAESRDWNWGPAIFLYPLLRIAPKSDFKDEYVNYIKRYHQHHIDEGLPKIQWADHCPSALSAFDLATQHQDDFAWSSVETVMDWIKNVKRNDIGSIDHLGYDNIKSAFYPSSIWVDSLVMWALLTVKYALYTKDEELLAFGVDQPFIFADKLRNPVTELYYHAWNIEKNQPLPADNAHWLRGNGWALVAMAEILTLIGEEHERYHDLAALFVDLAEATLPHRQPSGYWDTVIDDPGYAYEESSGSALIAVAYAKGVRLGLLDPEYRQYALDTFRAITARMKRRGEREENLFTMEEISSGTDPSNKLRYKLIPKDRNISYGVGAFLLLADELADDDFDAHEIPDIDDDGGAEDGGAQDGGAQDGGAEDPGNGDVGEPDTDPNSGADADVDSEQGDSTDQESTRDGSVDAENATSGSCGCVEVALSRDDSSLIYIMLRALFR